MQSALRYQGYSFLAVGVLTLFFACAGAPTKKEFSLADYGPHPFQSLYSPAAASDVNGLSDLNEDLIALYDAELEQVSPGQRFNDPRTRRRMQQTFTARNEALFSSLQKHLDQSPPNPAFISKSEAEAIRGELLNRAVSGETAGANFEDAGEIGFCFGRAAYVHLGLSQRGVPSQQMAKVFVFGHLRSGGTIWKYHMATMVKGIREGERVWWVIDSLMPKVLELSHWQREAARLSVVSGQADVRFYASAPEKFLPSFGEYALKQLQNEEYRGYFDRLGRRVLLKTPDQQSN